MDTKYSLPAHQRPIPRNTPVKTSASSDSVPGPAGGVVAGGGTERRSNALRASVLDAALELGIAGDNSLVAAWMFDNSLKEEDEEEPVASPGLTNSSSTASDEGGVHFSRYPPTPPELGLSSSLYPNNSSNNNGNTSNSYHNQFFARTGGKPVAGWDDAGNAVETSGGGGANSGVSFPDVPPSSQIPSTPSRKLKKKKSKVNVGGDGYESEGGYLSEGGAALSKKALKKEEKARAKQEKKEMKDLKEEERKRKKSSAKTSQQDELVTAPWASSGGVLERDPSNSSSTKKGSKKERSDGGYETDAGYVSAGGAPKKSKGRFFKLGLKGSRTDLKAESASAVEEVPPLPKEPLPLPIAERFASPTANGAFSTPSTSLDLARPSTQTQPFQLPASGGLELPTLDTSQPFFPEAAATASAQPQQRSPPLSAPSSQLQPTLSAPNVYPSPSPSPIPPPFVSYQEAVARHDRSSMSSSGHGHTSSATSSSSGHGYVVVNRGMSVTPTGPIVRSTSQTNSAAPSSSSTLTISYPLTRNAPSSSSIISAASTITPSTSGYAPSPATSTSTSTYVSSSSATLEPPRKFPQNLPRLDIHSRNGLISGSASPKQLSPSSPYVMVTSSGPSPVSAPSQLPGQLRPRNPPTEGFGPRTAPASSNPPSNLPSNTITHNLTNTYGAGGRLSPNPMVRARRLSPLLPPEGHPDATPLPSPNVLAYYDIPPPSPPPQGPLPSVPGGKDTSPTTSSGLRPRPTERAGAVEGMTSPNSLSVQPTQRGRVSPFPTQPVMVAPRPMYGSDSAHVQHVPGLEARVRQGGGGRYREPSVAYGAGIGGTMGGTMRREGLEQSVSPPRQRLPLREQYQPQIKPISPPQTHPTRNRVHFQSGSEEIPSPTALYHQQQQQLQQRSPPQPSYGFQRRPSQGSSNHSHGHGDYDDEYEDYNDRVSGAAEIQDVLDRFVENSGGEDSASSNDHHQAQTLPRRRSFEAALRDTRSPPLPSSNPPVAPPSTLRVQKPMDGERDTMYTIGGDDDQSIYSRLSIMDEDKSGTTRDRFIQRVEAMVRAKERANGGTEAPPVPSLSEGLANARSWNKF